MTALKLFIEIGGSYVCFGLALYAMSAIASFAWVRLGRRDDDSPQQRAAVKVCAATVVLIALELLRQVCESFHNERFPVWASRILLPATYVILGNAAFGLVHHEASKQLGEQAKDKRARARKRAVRVAAATGAVDSAEGGQLLARVSTEF